MELIQKYFPDLTKQQRTRFEKLLEIVPKLNEQVNVISRKDIGYLEERHLLHSLSIAKKFSFGPKIQVVDVGTGGGFPGIPLAIIFPETSFTLVDSIGKKIRVVEEVAELLALTNVTAVKARIEQLDLRADFVVSRAVTAFPMLWEWTRKMIVPGQRGNMANGLISLKGGELDDELKSFKNRVIQFPLSEYFEEAFFYTKKLVYLKK